MSICPKNNLLKQEENKRKSELEDERSEPGKMQQVWRVNDAHRVCKACGSYNKKEIVSVD